MPRQLEDRPPGRRVAVIPLREKSQSPPALVEGRSVAPLGSQLRRAEASMGDLQASQAEQRDLSGGCGGPDPGRRRSGVGLLH